MPYLPGQFVSVAISVAHNYGDECDCGVTAVTAMVGETDSFGSEFHPMCQECKDKHDSSDAEPEEGICDWCKKQAVLTPRRDFDEGSSGPVYYVCSPCIQKDNQRIAEESGPMDWGDDEDYYDYD